MLGRFGIFTYFCRQKCELKTIETMKKHLLLAILMLLPLVASAVDKVEINGIFYYLTSGETNTASVTSKSSGEYTGEVVIPESVTYEEVTYSVTSIGNGAFKNCSGLTSVIIPSSVTSIESSAFSGCSSLITVTIPNSVTSIGNASFQNCNSLLNVLLPDNINSIADYTFSGCSALLSVKLPQDVTAIGKNAFSFCQSLTSLEISQSVLSIGEGAFEYCKGLTTIEIPKGVAIINNEVFYHCETLSSVTLPETITSIGDRAFSNCEKLSSISIPESVISIGDHAFFNCSFSAISLPSALKMIKGGCFSLCSNLESITIPATVEYIYQEAFANCSSLKRVRSLVKTPPFLYDNSFSNYDITLTVPEGTRDAYLAKVPWNKFKEILSGSDTKYTLTYMVDGKVYKTIEFFEGSLITPEAEPTKEGYDFSGWSTIPATMPAKDVEVTGSFTLKTDEDVIKITSAGQSTWCSKYDLDFTGVEGVKAYIASGYNRTTGTIWLTRVNEVPANEGILIIGKAGDCKVPHKSTTTYYANLMVGTLKAITINEKEGDYTNYYLSNGSYGVGFYKVNGTQAIAANRAYLPLLKGDVPADTRFISLGFEDGEGTTGIKEVKSVEVKCEKWFNLQGQRVENPSKGLYIKNGKKVLVK